MRLLPYAWVLVIMQACFKEDERVMPYPGITTTISDSIQTNESFFDFETGRVAGSSSLRNWELGFECSKDGWRIITNSGAGWFIYNTRQTVITTDQLSMPLNLAGLYDIPHLWPDSTAVGHWVYPGDQNSYTDNVYLLGKYDNGKFHETRQVKFLELTDTSYTFCHKKDELAADTVLIVKNDHYNFTYYSFTLKNQVQPEPEKSNYDIVFTSYYDLATLFGQTIPYHVGGTLLNVWKTEVAIDSSLSFKDITTATITGLEFISQRDIPGYRWKNVTVDITGGGTATYDVKTDFNYIFKTQEGNFFKLRFLSYTLDGKSGFPRFEFSRLE